MPVEKWTIVRERERGKKHEWMKTRPSMKMQVTGKGHPQDEFHAPDVARPLIPTPLAFLLNKKGILPYFSKYMYFHAIPAKQPDIASEMKVPLK